MSAAKRASKASADKVLVGIDLGGTNIKAGIVTPEGEMLARSRCETRAQEGPDAVISRMADLAERLLDEEKIDRSRVIAVGVGSPGPLSSARGVVVYTPNLPGWTDIPVSAKMKERLGLDVFLENDANSACWGEYWRGAGRGTKTMVIFTLGTGVGGGIVLDGRLLRGIDDTAGHLGHIIVDPEGPRCGCGNRGCLEAYASATALVRRYHEAVAEGSKSSLKDKPRGEVTARDIHEAASGGDALCRSLMEETGRWLGVALATVANVINPELAVYSGGMAAAGGMLFEPIMREVRHRALRPPAARLRLAQAQLGDDAGVVGAAGCALTRAQESR